MAEGDICALCREGSGDRCADPPAAAGDEGCAVLELACYGHRLASILYCIQCSPLRRQRTTIDIGGQATARASFRAASKWPRSSGFQTHIWPQIEGTSRQTPFGMRLAS